MIVDSGIVQDNQLAALAKWVGRQDWLATPLATPAARRTNFYTIDHELAATFATREAAEWEAEPGAIAR